MTYLPNTLHWLHCTEISFENGNDVVVLILYSTFAMDTSARLRVASFMSSNIPSSLAYGVYVSQLLSYLRACTTATSKKDMFYWQLNYSIKASRSRDFMFMADIQGNSPIMTHRSSPRCPMQSHTMTFLWSFHFSLPGTKVSDGDFMNDGCYR